MTERTLISTRLVDLSFDIPVANEPYANLSQEDLIARWELLSKIAFQMVSVLEAVLIYPGNADLLHRLTRTTTEMIVEELRETQNLDSASDEGDELG